MSDMDIIEEEENDVQEISNIRVEERPSTCCQE